MPNSGLLPARPDFGASEHCKLGAEIQQQMLAAAAQANGQTRLTQFFAAQPGVAGGAQAGVEMGADDAMVE